MPELPEKENKVANNVPTTSKSVSVEAKAKEDGEPSGTPSKPSVWGEHLNKPNYSLELATPKAALSSSSSSSYSKLTQKLMKGS